MQNIRREIIELHDAVAEWIAGGCPGDDETFHARIGQRFSEDFTLVAPGGRRLSGADVLGGMRSGHGSNPAFRIAIRDVDVVTDNDRIVVATCTEWQRGAKLSERAENGRALTIVFERDDSRPSGFVWRHAQETWLPENEQAAASYDF